MNKYHHTKNQLGIKAEAYTTDETAEGWTYGQGLHCTQTWTISMYYNGYRNSMTKVFYDVSYKFDNNQSTEQC